MKMVEAWFIFAFTAAILTTLTAIIEKKTLLKEHAMEFSTILSIFTLLISAPLFFYIDYSALKLTPLLLLLFTTILGATAFLFTAKAIRHMEVSDAVPLITLSPAIVAVLALIFLKETLSLQQLGGITLLITGAYILETKSSINLLDPLKPFRKSKYINYILLALILYGITALFDRIILFNLNMQPQAFIAFAHLFLAFHFIIMLNFFHNGFKGISHGITKAGPWIFLVAIFVVGYRYAQAEAIKLVTPSLVLAIKHTSVFFTVILGGEIYKEGRILRKSIASIIMILGVFLIVL